MGASSQHVRLVAKSGLMHRSKRRAWDSLLDHLVGVGEHCRWNFEAERLRSSKPAGSDIRRLIGCRTPEILGGEGRSYDPNAGM